MRCNKCGMDFAASSDYPYTICYGCNLDLSELIRIESGATGCYHERQVGALVGLVLLGTGVLLVVALLIAIYWTFTGVT